MDIESNNQIENQSSVCVADQYLDVILPQQLKPDLVRKLPLEFLKKQCAIPIILVDGTIAVAMADVLNVEAYDAIINVLAQPCNRVICPTSEIERAISRCYYQGTDIDQLQQDSGHKSVPSATDGTQDSKHEPLISGLEPNSSDHVVDTTSIQTHAEDLLNIAGKAPVIKLVNKIFFRLFTAEPVTFTSSRMRTSYEFAFE